MATIARTTRRTTKKVAQPPARERSPQDRGRRDEVETWLEEWHVEYSHNPGVAPEQFDAERSLRNQARLGDVVDDEVVDRYADAMAEGAEFPAVVAWKDNAQRYVLIDGNHRLMAARKAGYELAVYEVRAKAQTITAMTFEANVRHGKATTEEERVHHALYLIDNGMSKKEAAKRMGVAVSKINKHSLAVEAARRAEAAGVSMKDWDALPDAMRNRISQISTDEALVGAVKLVQDAGLQTTEVFELVALINDTRSGRKQLEILDAQRRVLSEQIQDKRAGVAPGKGKRVGRSPKSALASVLGFTVSLPEPATIRSVMGDVERQEYLPRVDAAIKRLQAVKASLSEAD